MIVKISIRKQIFVADIEPRINCTNWLYNEEINLFCEFAKLSIRTLIILIKIFFHLSGIIVSLNVANTIFLAN